MPNRGDMTPEQIEEHLLKFAAEKRETGDGLLIFTEKVEDGEKNVFFLGPDGDYCLQVGPRFEASTVEYSNGTTQITIKRIEDGDDA